jgi:hypothetical protein
MRGVEAEELERLAKAAFSHGLSAPSFESLTNASVLALTFTGQGKLGRHKDAISAAPASDIAFISLGCSQPRTLYIERSGQEERNEVMHYSGPADLFREHYHRVVFNSSPTDDYIMQSDRHPRLDRSELRNAKPRLRDQSERWQLDA